MSVTIYGIKTCDTVRKARAWLDGHGVAYRFHDFRAEGLERDRLAGWVKAVGWEVLLNKAGTTFRKLPEADRQDIDEPKAMALMLREPTVIKRPVLENGAAVSVGFKPGQYEALFPGS
ncbi:ArsC family reductase [Ancylobacter sp. 6x-1]|uniref:ArsC family reductase n=1 Tax=Ancylobacter crimeensis TaxID=2579147 RepID=A0ABT0D636_9HYPH|nr:ArsC family reductase [Ancylobacter crimeensis]MCK0195397.1 ArsC family reductase [Ancylobacter crimeensis]